MHVFIFALLIMLSLLTGCGGGGSNLPSQPTDTSVSEPVDSSSSDDGSGDSASDEVSEEGAEGSAEVVEVDGDGSTTVNLTDLEAELDVSPVGVISAAELTGLLLMREEEKLAHDVYITLFDIHQLKIFQNIANSETSHTEAVLRLLTRYNIDDPVSDNGVGVFADTDLQVLYDTLVAQGTPSLMDALMVGARVEELDIFDIQRLQNDVVDNDDILLVYDNLLMGSRNHLRAFNKQLNSNGWTYIPEYISQDAYDQIVDSEVEQGGRGG